MAKELKSQFYKDREIIVSIKERNRQRKIKASRYTPKREQRVKKIPSVSEDLDTLLNIIEKSGLV